MPWTGPSANAGWWWRWAESVGVVQSVVVWCGVVWYGLELDGSGSAREIVSSAPGVSQGFGGLELEWLAPNQPWVRKEATETSQQWKALALALAFGFGWLCNSAMPISGSDKKWDLFMCSSAPTPNAKPTPDSQLQYTYV
ncbi:hypothetical protein AC578_1679 [Pseudocercospora eumusae]|uniref:Uncharacterized protein n=1 Tax=Pseudocercospora eumusae TaxID=321146 RepID=A0A139GXF3_9PEZI|nr:hypothetical protein AC578_1679 [Pseudocercospora eumusae]